MSEMLDVPKRKYRRYGSIARDIALETVRSYLRAGSPIGIAIFNAAQDCDIGHGTLYFYWYQRERQNQGLE